MEAESAISSDALLPLRDALRCLAHVFGRATSAIRAGVVRHADPSIQSVLRSSPPSSDFFFGNPATQVSSSLRMAFLSSLIQRPHAQGDDVDDIGDNNYVGDNYVSDDNYVSNNDYVGDNDCW